MRALVVDDSRAMRTILTKMLTELDFEVGQAEDGIAALAQMRRDVPAVALVDWNMPNMNGLELVLAIRRQRGYADVKLMMVTTESEMHQIMRALEAGADEYVTKPFTRDVIVEKLEILGFPVAEHA